MSLSKPLFLPEGAVNCSVCFEPLRKVPVRHCENGHFVCSDCRAKIRTCPVCRSSGMNFRSSLADAVIESWPLPCKFKAQGCLSEDLKMMERDKHEETCMYRTVKCPESNCQEMVSLPHLLDHLKGHSKPNVSLQVENRVTRSLGLTGGISGNRYWPSKHILEDEDNFVDKWMVGKSKELHWWVYFIGSREEAKKFEVQLELENNGGESASFVFEPISIDVPKDEVIRRGLDLEMPNSLVQKFVQGNELCFWSNIGKKYVPESAPIQDPPGPAMNSSSPHQAVSSTDQAQNPCDRSSE